jgi:autotransporter-associated beta strand protein
VSGTIQDGGGSGGSLASLVKVGTGTLTLAGANTYTGGTTINAGTLQLGNGGASGSILGNVVNNAIFAINRSDVFTFGGVISGTGAFQQNGAGTTTINAGTLQLGNGGASCSIAGDLVNNGVFAINRSDMLTFGGVISGTGAFQQNGTGTTTLTGSNTYTGGTALNAGTLAVGSNTALGTSALAFASGTTLQAAANGLSLANAMTLSGADTVDTQTNALTLSGTISGSGGLTKIGSGVLTLSGANTYSGGTTLAAGTLSLANNQALGSGALTTTSSVVDYANGVTIANPIVVNSNTTQLQVTSGSATQAGVISELNGPRPLEKIGGGTLVGQHLQRPDHDHRRGADRERLDRQFGGDGESRRHARGQWRGGIDHHHQRQRVRPRPDEQPRHHDSAGQSHVPVGRALSGARHALDRVERQRDGQRHACRHRAGGVRVRAATWRAITRSSRPRAGSTAPSTR